MGWVPQKLQPIADSFIGSFSNLIKAAATAISASEGFKKAMGQKGRKPVERHGKSPKAKRRKLRKIAHESRRRNRVA